MYKKNWNFQNQKIITTKRRVTALLGCLILNVLKYEINKRNKKIFLLFILLQFNSKFKIYN